MKNLFIVLLLCTVGAISYDKYGPEDFDLSFGKDDNAINLVVEEYHPLVVSAFDEAEKELLVKEDIDEDVEKMDPDPEKCICKGTGLLPTDGSVTLYCKYHGNRMSSEAPSECNCSVEEAESGKCPCGENCSCNHEVLAGATKEVEPKIETKPYIKKDRTNDSKKTEYQVIMFSAEWCKPCEAFKKGPLKELEDSIEGLVVGSSVSSDFRVLDIDSPDVKDFYRSLNLGDYTVPMFIEVKDNTVLSRRIGAKVDLQFLLDTYDFEE